MCSVCGCGGTPHDHPHEDAHHHDNAHQHQHAHHHGEGGALQFGVGPERLVRVERDILAHNDTIAAVNRARLAAAGTLALNLVSSPGSGKTTLLEHTIRALAGRIPLAVIEGDQRSSNDAERIRATGAPALQINTGRGCHLDAAMISDALDRLAAPAGGVLFIENVGNLVCPAGFDLGEDHKVVMLSVTEGDDKPEKYPDMFAASDLMLITKVDLLPYVTFSPARAIALARRLNPRMGVVQVSAQDGQGMGAWCDWIIHRAAARRALGMVTG